MIPSQKAIQKVLGLISKESPLHFYQSGFPTYCNYLTILQQLGSVSSGDDRWHAILTRDNSRVGQNAARIGDQSSDAGEKYRPDGGSGGTDHYVPGLQPGELIFVQDNPYHAGILARRGSDAFDAITVFLLLGALL